MDDYVAAFARNGKTYAADLVASYTAESALVDAFDRLSDRYRLVLILTLAEGRPCADADSALNLGDDAVAALAYRARKQLRTLIVEEIGVLETSSEWAIQQERSARQIVSSFAL